MNVVGVRRVTVGESERKPKRLSHRTEARDTSKNRFRKYLTGIKSVKDL